MNISDTLRRVGAGGNLRLEWQRPFPFWLVAVAVACGYYMGARFGFALTLGTNPISVL